MPLPLDDPRWKKLKGSYGSTEDIVAWLDEAYRQGSLSDEHLGNLINEIQHQGSTSTAMYAVAPHLVALARRATPETALALLTHAGIIHAASDQRGAARCPAFLNEEFTASARDGTQMLVRLLPLAVEFATFKWAVAGLAGFMGHHSFARFLDGLDLYKGQFHHPLLDEPFPPDV